MATAYKLDARLARPRPRRFGSAVVWLLVVASCGQGPEVGVGVGVESIVTPSTSSTAGPDAEASSGPTSTEEIADLDDAEEEAREPDCPAWNAALSAPEGGLDLGIGTIVDDYFGHCAPDLGPNESRNGVEFNYSRWSAAIDFLARYDEDNASGILFVLENGELIGAFWWMSPDELAPWSATFDVRGGEAVVESSLGHGMTELDDWDPAIILDRWADDRPDYEELKEADNG